MKRTALTHTKMRRLMRALDVPLYAAVGIMEALWNLTAKETPRGDIGKLSNEDIAVQLDWRGDPDELIRALLTAGWLDIQEDLRLVVHDWHDHADDSVDNQLARSGQTYANGKVPHMRRLTTKERDKLQAVYHERIKAHGKRTASARRAHKSAQPEPLPVPVPVPVPIEKQIPSRGKREEKAPDPRHVPFRTACKVYAVDKHVAFVWDASEAKSLDLLLKAAPDLTLLVFQGCLNNRARSPGTPHGERPRVWLPHILRYQQGPLNEYNRTEEASGTPKRHPEVGIYQGESAIPDADVDAFRAKRGLPPLEASP